MADENKAPYEVPTFYNWSQLARFYHPLQAGSIDGTDLVAHDRAIWRAMHAKYKPNKKVTGNPKSTLFVGRISRDTVQATLERKFSKYGEIKNCRLIRDIVTGFSKGYAFIEYEHERDATVAYREMYKADIDGREILVDYELERTLDGWIPRRLGGGFGGKKESGQLRFGGRDRTFRRPLPTQTLGQATRHSDNTDRDRGWQSSRGRDRDDNRDRDNSRDRDCYRRPNRERDRERTSGRDRDRYRDIKHHDRERGNRNRERDYDRERDYVRERDSNRERDYDRERDSNRERDYDRERDSNRDHDLDRDSKQDRDNDRGSERDLIRQPDRNAIADRENDDSPRHEQVEDSRGYDRDRYSDRHRERSRSKDDYKRRDRDRYKKK